MTPQQIFDTVVTHLRAQGKAARDEFGTCSYRTDDGLKCAVGCLIPDSMYKLTMESNTVAGLIEVGFVLPSYFKDNKDLLEMLQNTHDREFVDEWEGLFKKVADSHRLRYSPPAARNGSQVPI